MSSTVSSKELSNQWIQLQRHKQEHPELYRLKSTGLAALDKILGGGLEPGQFVLVGGAQKSGKTTLLSCLTETMARQHMNVLYLSGEMTTIQMASIFFSRLSRIDRTRIRAINLDETDWVKLENAAAKFEKFNIWWNHGFSSVTDINNIITEMETVHGVEFDCIMVDYIQLMEAPEIKSGGNRVTDLSYISRNLKRRTLSGKKPKLIIAAAQINRQSIRGNLYDANSFLGTGDLERDMDIGMLIKAVQDPITGVENKHRKQIIVVGSRETEIGVCETYYNGSIASIEDAEDDPAEKDMRGVTF